MARIASAQPVARRASKLFWFHRPAALAAVCIVLTTILLWPGRPVPKPSPGPIAASSGRPRRKTPLRGTGPRPQCWPDGPRILTNRSKRKCAPSCRTPGARSSRWLTTSFPKNCARPSWQKRPPGAETQRGQRHQSGDSAVVPVQSSVRTARLACPLAGQCHRGHPLCHSIRPKGF